MPSASAPAAMLANAGVLLAAATLLVVGHVTIAARVWDGAGRRAAALAVLLLMVATSGYLANLLARSRYRQARRSPRIGGPVAGGGEQ